MELRAYLFQLSEAFRLWKSEAETTSQFLGELFSCEKAMEDSLE
jgi:hypothetical protein